MKKRVVNVPALETGAPYNLCICYGDIIYVAGLPPFDTEFSKKLREARASGSPPPTFTELSFERQVELVMGQSQDADGSRRFEHGLPAGHGLAQRPVDRTSSIAFTGAISGPPKRCRRALVSRPAVCQ
jgi:hypothetical protein